MGNAIVHKKITIEFDTWEPFYKDADADLWDLSNKIKAKELLKHCGNVHVHFEERKEEAI